MKKVFTSLFLLMFGVIASHATLKVAGVTVSSTGNVSAGQTGTIHYNASSHLLTFTDVTISSSSSEIIYYDGTDKLYVKFNGKNTLSSSSNTVVFSYHADLVLYGEEGAGGSATIKYTGTSDSKCGVYIRDGKKLTIHNLFLTINNPGHSGLYAEDAASSLSVYTAVLDITAGSDYGAVRNFGSASFDSSDAYLINGQYYDTSKKCVCSSNGTPAKHVQTDAPLFVGNAIVGIGYGYDFPVVPSGLSEGSITFKNGSKTLVFDAVKITVPTADSGAGNTRVVFNKNLDGLTIQFNGNNTLATASTAGGSVIKSVKPVTIKGQGVDLGKLTTLKGNIGIYAPEGNVTIDNASVFADCLLGICGETSLPLDLTVKNAFLAAKGTNGSIRDIANCTLTGVQVAADIAPGVCYRKDKKWFGTATELYKDVIWILPWSTDYNVTVLGEKVTDLNLSNIAVDGLTEGTITYDKDNKVLTLDGVTMNGPEESGTEVYGISGTGLSKIVFNGTNKITTDGSCFCIKNDVTMEGSGSIIATSNKHSGIRNESSLIININNTAKFFGKLNGIFNDGVRPLTLTKAGNASDYYFKGTDVAALRASTLTLTDMDFWSGSDGTPGCYFDDEYVMQNGGEKVKGDKVVNIYRLNDADKYNLYVGGVQVTNCNKYGIGSKLIKSGGGTAVTYSSGLLTLTDATMDRGDVSVNLIYNTGIDNLVINVSGTNQLTSASTKSTIKVQKNTTIKGDGSLKLIGGFGDIGADNSAVVNLTDVNIDCAADFYGNSSAKLNIKLTTPGKRIKVNKVYDWSQISLLDGTKIIEPDGAVVSSDGSKIVTASGSSATGIVIGDASATGIEGVIMNADAEVTGIFDAEGRQLNEMQPGVNILRMSDGTTRKVIKK